MLCVVDLDSQVCQLVQMEIHMHATVVKTFYLRQYAYDKITCTGMHPITNDFSMLLNEFQYFLLSMITTGSNLVCLELCDSEGGPPLQCTVIENGPAKE